MNDRPRVSVIIPAFDEEKTILRCIERVLEQGFTAEIVVVDDGSTDRTAAVVRGLRNDRIRLISHRINRGKGASIRTAIPFCRADYIVIQDADLEYDPADIAQMLEPLDSGKADVVYGSRFLPIGARRALYFWHTLGNKLLTLGSNMVSNLNLTDMETCYKIFRREALQSLVLEESRFGIEPELTIKAAAAGFAFFEVGISYDGRTYAEGKKIGWRDGFSAARCITSYGYVESMRKRRRRRLAKQSNQSELLISLEDLKTADNYYNWIVDQIQPYLNPKVLEIGAGVGTVSRLVASKGHEVFAIEPSASAYRELNKLAQRHIIQRAFNGSLHDLEASLDADFDSVILINVLEHIDDEVKELNTISRHLKPGGHILIWVPAHELLFSKFDESVGHFRRYSKRRLGILAEMAGLEIVVLKYVNPIGAVGWMVTAKGLRMSPTASLLTGIFDKHVVPVARRIEEGWDPPFGQSVLMIARKP